MTIAIIGAMEQEVAILKDKMNNRVETKIADFVFYSGKLNNQDVVLVQSGIGKVASTIATALVIERFSPKYVINTGSAGGFDPALKVGDIAVGNELVHHDVDVTAFDYAFGQVPGMPATFKADETLIAVAQQCINNLDGITSKVGLIATGDSFMCDPERINQTRERFPTMLAVEMEGAAIAQTCHQLKTPFLVIRSLSDIAGQESPMSFDAYLEVASKNSSALMLDILSQL
ncbi:MAG: adenosylhomocysteine nucleosidase [Psychrosphaera sp.]|jgi:adenosylhomocysteine nucleosidase|uniref:5'-methylthioadenosine/S-adenosylhomocysteine nucleosidase n=1 Tax=Psychrosphaera aquimarina TaxID=2044854 RepID=A0ABU3R0X2_9GAMM|nr:5'-methylthioadenosine/S-adenosylhomocysteine nucleosidase [Psychrosphaera aquimarina]MDU0113127.1 5'-methylthioadenosine/S-adenosylhomocysteine nucleosidase [Psychrosphaera aquimarina]